METKKEKFDWVKNLNENRLEDAWMLDYHHVNDCRWVRMPFLTWNQVIRILDNMGRGRLIHRLDNMLNKEGFEDVDWSSVRIHSERELDEMVDENGRLEDLYPKDKDYKFVPVCNKRAYLFSERYDNVEMYRSGEIDPNHIRSWQISTYPLEDADEVIKALREEYPDGIDWDEYDAEKVA